MKKLALVTAIAAISLTACVGSAASADPAASPSPTASSLPNPAACKQAMTERYENALEGKFVEDPSKRPTECDGVDENTIKWIAEEILLRDLEGPTG